MAPKPPRLYRRSSGYWVILYGGHETSTGTKDRRLAEQSLAAYSTLRIRDIVSAYEQRRYVRADFIASTARPIKKWWGDRPVTAINRASCEAYVAWRTRKVSIATARHDLKTLRAAINYHHSHSPLAILPKITMPPAPEPRSGYFLTRKQVADRVRAARSMHLEHIVRFLLIGIYSGSRPGDILRMQWLPAESGWADIDSGILHRPPSKGRKRRTTARIHQALLPHLIHWRSRDLAAGITYCIHYRGSKIGKLRHSWRSVATAAGHGHDGPHIVRHTCVTWLMQSGVSIYEAAGYVGMSPQIIEQVYGHHHPDHQLSAARARGK